MSAPRSSSTAPPSNPQPDLPHDNEQHLYFINSNLTNSAFLSTTKHLFSHTRIIGSKHKTLLDLFKKHFIPWAIISFDTAMKEILGPSSAKISNGSFSVHDHDKISHVISLSQKINPFLALASFKLEESLPPLLLLGDNTSFPTHTFLDVWWSFALFEWHTYITAQFKKVIHNSFLSKMELGLGFYNFTQHNLPPNINELLIKGKKFSPLSTEDAAINPGQDRFLFVEYMASLIQWTAKHFDGINLDPSHIMEKGITSTLANCHITLNPLVSYGVLSLTNLKLPLSRILLTLNHMLFSLIPPTRNASLALAMYGTSLKTPYLPSLTSILVSSYYPSNAS